MSPKMYIYALYNITTRKKCCINNLFSLASQCLLAWRTHFGEIRCISLNRLYPQVVDQPKPRRVKVRRGRIKQGQDFGTWNELDDRKINYFQQEFIYEQRNNKVQEKTVSRLGIRSCVEGRKYNDVTIGSLLM